MLNLAPYKTKSILRLGLIVLLFCFSDLVSAQELSIYNQSVRQQGMGGVYVFRDDDASSMLQNPAYTCYTEGLNWSFIGLGVGFNDINNYTKITEVSDTINNNGGTISLNDLAPLYGSRYRTSFDAQSTLTLPCFGLSAWNDGYAAFKLENPILPNLSIEYLNDYAYQLAFAFPIGPIKFGLAPKRVYRSGGTGDFGAASIDGLTGDSIRNAIEQVGAAYAIDIGLASRRTELPFNPTFSFAWKDVGTTTFLATSSRPAPQKQKDNMILAMTFDGSVPLFGIAGGVEYRHANDNNTPFAKKLHLGAEISFATIDLRAGFYQGYTTYGLGMDLFIASFEVSTYQVETGAYAGQAGDPRYNASLLFSFGFDPNFNLVSYGAGGQGAAKRKLKQRR